MFLFFFSLNLCLLSIKLWLTRDLPWRFRQNGGHCQPLVYSAAPEVGLFELKTYRFLRDFVTENKIPCGWRSFKGVHSFLTEEVFKVAAAAVEHLKKKEPILASTITVVPPSATAEDGKGHTLASLRIPFAKGAIVQQNAASLWPYKLVCWVLEKLLSDFSASSFNLQTKTPVTGLRQQSAAEGGDFPWVVQTSRGPVAARNVLLATNAYTSRLLPAFADLIVPVRGQIGALLPPSPPQPPVLLDHSYIFLGEFPSSDGPPVTKDEYLVQRPLPNGELIFGGGRNAARERAVGEWRDDEVEASVGTYLRSELAPNLDLRSTNPKSGAGQGRDNTELKASFEWTGIMGFSRDDKPWVGAVPESVGGGTGLWLSASYTGHGMPQAALCAKAVIDMITGGSAKGYSEMPDSFLITEERLVAARTLDTVKAKGERGLIAEFSHLFSTVEAETNHASSDNHARARY